MVETRPQVSPAVSRAAVASTAAVSPAVSRTPAVAKPVSSQSGSCQPAVAKPVSNKPVSHPAAVNKSVSEMAVATVAAPRNGNESLVEEVHRRALDVIDTNGDGMVRPVDVDSIVRTMAPLAPTHVVDDVVARVSARIDGLGPIEPLLSDPAVSEVMVNGPGPVWIEHDGTIRRTEVLLDRAAVDLLIERIVAPLGRRVDQRTPCVDGRLLDGSRVHVVVPPVAVDGPYVTIRRFVVPDVGLEMFTHTDSISLLDELVDRGANVVVSGGTGAGKTTLLNALTGRVSPDHRVITIEDAAELQLNHPHVVRLEARPESREGTGAVTIRDLVRNALRMRPDRLIVGEVRGPEALDLLHALNTGHAGCLSTVHANGPTDALRRLATLATSADERLPVEAVREHITAAIDVIVHVERQADGARRIAEVAEVTGHDQVQLLADSAKVLTEISRPARLQGGRASKTAASATAASATAAVRNGSQVCGPQSL